LFATKRKKENDERTKVRGQRRAKEKTP